jgi:hypothetical protein
VGTNRLIWAKFTPREGNTGEVYVGDSSVSATDGVELDPGGTSRQKDELIMPFREMGLTVAASEIYFDTDTNGNDIDFAMVVED